MYQKVKDKGDSLPAQATHATLAAGRTRSAEGSCTVVSAVSHIGHHLHTWSTSSPRRLLSLCAKSGEAGDSNCGA